MRVFPSPLRGGVRGGGNPDATNGSPASLATKSFTGGPYFAFDRLGQSMTIWGVITTTLSTVLPAFGPLLGLDVTAELVRQLGDQIVVIVQAVGGLIGTILTIWGRARATTTLERKQITMNM